MPAYRLVVTAEAELDITDGYRWYEEQAKMGDAFVFAVDGQLGHIESHPFASAVVAHGIRRSIVRRFPYNIYYSINGEFIDILAIWHGHRDQERLLASYVEFDQ